MIPAIINKRYEILEKIGEGGIGVIYCANDIFNSHKVALKVINPSIVSSEVIANFKKEFEIVSRIKHPNLIEVNGFGFDPEQKTYYLTMEHINGESCETLLLRSKTLSFEDTVRILIHVSRGLEFIHSRKIVHRDISPGNILVTSTAIKLTDFGMAGISGSSSYNLGTIGYCAPELLTGEIDYRFDFYSLGITLYECLTGAPFYQTRDSQQILTILHDPLLFEKTRQNAFDLIKDNGIQSLLSQMITYRVEERIGSGVDILIRLRQALSQDIPLETDETKRAYVSGTALIGRQREYKEITGCCLEASRPESVYCITGDPGVGKSRLLQEIEIFCQLNDILFVTGFCFPEITAQFGPFLTILNEFLLVCSDELIERHMNLLSVILPNHGRLLPMKKVPLQMQPLELDKQIKGISEFLFDFCQTYPKRILIAIDNFQWADETSMRLMKKILLRDENRVSGEHRNGIPLIVLSYRDSESESLNSLVCHSKVRQIPLFSFQREQVRDYIHSIFGEKSIGKSLYDAVDTIHSKVGGNPLFLQEFIKSLIENNMLERHSVYWELASASITADTPLKIEEILLSRINNYHFSSQELRALQVMALFTRLNTLAELSLFTPVSGLFLQRMVDAEFVMKIVINGENYYKTANHMVRKAFYDTISDKMELHHAIALQLENLHKDDVETFAEELAYHYFHAGHVTKAKEHGLKAAKKARAANENKKAVEIYQRILPLFDSSQPLIRAEILFELGTILPDIGSLKAGADALEEAVDLLHGTDNELLGQALLFLATILCALYRKNETFAKINEARAYYTDRNDTSGMVKVYNRLGNFYDLFEKNYDKAIECYNKGIGLATEVHDTQTLALIIFNSALVLMAKGEFALAAKQIVQTLKIDEKLNDLNRLVRGCIWQALCQFHMKQYDISETFLKKCIEYSKEADLNYFECWATMIQVKIYLVKQLYEEARKFRNHMMLLMREIDEDNFFINASIVSA
ncbi:MAG: protein kinase, partial [Chitinivibrionales bacterium]|nr:protein kinase [Chitinivibrionales bacterium]